MKANINSLDCNILCGPDTTVVLPVVPQPAPTSGVFSIGVLEAAGSLLGLSLRRERGKLTVDVPLYAVGRIVAETGSGRLI